MPEEELTVHNIVNNYIKSKHFKTKTNKLLLVPMLLLASRVKMIKFWGVVSVNLAGHSSFEV